VNPRRSFRFRLTLAALLPLLLAMTAAWAVATFVFTRALDQRVEQQIENAANVLTGGGLPFTTELLQRVADLQQVQIALLDANGRVIARTQGDLAVRSAETAVHDGMADFREARPRHFDVGGEPTIVVMRPVAGGSNPNVAAVLVAASLRDARDAGRSAALGIGLAVIAAGALLIVLQYLLLRGITRPVSRLVNVAHEIASGRRDVRADADRQDELQALATALNDMTDKLAKYEAELAERSRLAALGEMSARLAHEIRNPLTGLKLHLQLLAERIDPSDSARVERLLAEVQRLELLVSSTLMLGGEQPLDAAPARIGPLVTEVLDLMEPSLSHRGIRAKSRCDDALQACVDRGRLRQALLNLIVNAADAMPQGGHLLIRSELDPAASRLLICVEDSGPGVTDEIRTRLLEAPISTKPFGLGLGLTVCRDVAAAHGGELLIGQSMELGGARFVIALPLSAAPPSAAHGA
jgi:signal transduction histidine kinase